MFFDEKELHLSISSSRFCSSDKCIILVEQGYLTSPVDYAILASVFSLFSLFITLDYFLRSILMHTYAHT